MGLVPMVVGLIPGLAQWVGDLVLQWLWCRLAAVVWDPPYPAGGALKKKKKLKFILEGKGSRIAKTTLMKKNLQD